MGEQFSLLDGLVFNTRTMSKSNRKKSPSSSPSSPMTKEDSQADLVSLLQTVATNIQKSNQVLADLSDMGDGLSGVQSALVDLQGQNRALAKQVSQMGPDGRSGELPDQVESEVDNVEALDDQDKDNKPEL